MFTDSYRCTWALQKYATRQKVAARLSLPFSRLKTGCMKKVKTSNISGTMQPIFFILLPCVWENNGLLNNRYWHDLDITDKGHSKDSIS